MSLYKHKYNHNVLEHSHTQTKKLNIDGDEITAMLPYFTENNTVVSFKEHTHLM